jgi:hypothetical protein
MDRNTSYDRNRRSKMPGGTSPPFAQPAESGSEPATVTVLNIWNSSAADLHAAVTGALFSGTSVDNYPIQRRNYAASACSEFFTARVAQAIGCTFDKYEDLLLDQKLRCAGQLALSGIGAQLALARDEQRLRIVWEREYARKRALFLVPCSSPTGLDLITPARCAAGIALSGFGSDKLPTYANHPGGARSRSRKRHRDTFVSPNRRRST